jgi:hypothetical protein
MGVTYEEEISPLVYYPDDPSIVVYRTTVYDDGTKVGYVDWRNVEDATFLMFMLIEPDYRKGRWQPLFSEALDDTWENPYKFVMPNMDPALKEILPTIMSSRPAEYYVQSGGWFSNDGVEYYNTLGE